MSDQSQKRIVLRIFERIEGGRLVGGDDRYGFQNMPPSEQPLLDTVLSVEQWERVRKAVMEVL